MNLLFLQRHYWYQKYWAKLVKNWQKVVQKKVVNPLHLRNNHASGYIEEKNGNKYLIFDFVNENKEVLKNTQMSGMDLKTK